MGIGRRGRPANPTVDDFQDPILVHGEGQEPAEELENGSESEEMEASNGVPSEIAEMVQSFGLTGDYRVSLFKIPEGSRKSILQASYQNRIPEVEDFASEFGGGDYVLVFTWYQKDGKVSTKVQKRINLSIGKHYDLIAKKKEIEKKRDFQMENTMMPVAGDKDNPLDMLIKYQSLLPKQSNSLESVLPVMLGMMQQNTQQMMAAMQANFNMFMQMQQGRKTFAEELREMKDVSEMLGGNSKSESISSLLITEGASLLKEYAPVIKEAISKLNNPFLRRIAKNEVLNNPQIQAILADPEKKMAFIEHLYSENPAGEVDNALIQLGAITEEQRRAK